MSGYFCDPDTKWYMTRGINEHMNPFHMLIIMRLIERLKASKVKPDYLQVFRFSYDGNTKKQKVKHTQEQPDYEYSTEYDLDAGVEPFSDKVYVIDDQTHITVLKADEY